MKSEREGSLKGRERSCCQFYFRRKSKFSSDGSRGRSPLGRAWRDVEATEEAGLWGLQKDPHPLRKARQKKPVW